MSIRKGGNLILEDSIHPARIADSFATIIIQVVRVATRHNIFVLDAFLFGVFFNLFDFQILIQLDFRHF